jgi:glycine oxidase
MNHPRKAFDVIVAGAGAIGLAAAWRLARAGLSVLVLDRGDPGLGATWAAGGMLVPLGEAPGPGPLLRAGSLSLDMYPAFAGQLLEDSGIDVLLRPVGKLVCAYGEPGVERLRARHAWQSEAGHDVDLLSGAEARELEPLLSTEVCCALHLKDDAHVDNRLLAAALARASTQKDVEVRRHTPVKGLWVERDRIRGVRLDDGTTVEGECVVLACGAWSGQLEDLPEPLPVRPVRGQMILLESSHELPRPLLSAPGAYVIPLGGPRRREVMVGASQEEAGFEIQTDRGTLQALRDAAVRCVPSLARARRCDAWAGLRPGSPDELPILGRSKHLEGLIYATGHFRNGILLTPYTAEAVAAFVLGRTTPPGIEAFAADRF